eukprot:gene37856-45988_t
MSFAQILQTGILLQVLPHLGLKEVLLSTALVNKKFCELSPFQLLIHNGSGVDRSRLTTLAKDQLTELLTLARKVVFEEELVDIPDEATDAVIKANSLHVLGLNPAFLHHFMRINAAMYTYWDSLPLDPNFGVFEAAQAQLQESDDTRAEHLLSLFIRNGKYWGTSRVQGNFVFLFDRPDGGIMVSSDYQRVYLVLGLGQSIGDLCNIGFKNGNFYRKNPLPEYRMHSRIGGMQISAMLLNWEGKITCDGFITPVSIATKVMVQNALKAYEKAYNEGTIISQLELIAPAKKASVLDEGEVQVFTNALRDDLTAIMSKPQAPDTNNAWFLSRYGFTEETNPDHFLIIRTKVGDLPFYSSAIDPTPVECIKFIRETADQLKVRPAYVLIDSRPAVEYVAKILGKLDIDGYVRILPSHLSRRWNSSVGVYWL